MRTADSVYSEGYAEYRRFNVVGTSGSGKSTFSCQLADVLSLSYIEIDQLFWKPNWEHLNDEELFKTITKITHTDNWVLDGNYSRTMPLKWARVECVIWIDHPFITTVYRAVTRAIVRAALKKELWPGTGNRESFRRSFFSRESVLLWTLKTYHQNRKKYAALMKDSSFEHIEFVRLQSQKEVDSFLDSLG